MLKFKQFLIEGIVQRNSVGTLFSQENNQFFNPKTGTYDFSVFHSGSGDLTVPGSIRTLSTIPKPEKAAELWRSQVGSSPSSRGNVARDLTQYTREGSWLDAQTPSKLETTTIGFHTTPDPIGAYDYRSTDFKPNEFGMQQGTRVFSHDISIRPEEIQHFDNMGAYEEHIRSLRDARTPGDWRIRDEDSLRAARDFRARGIKGVSIKQGSGPKSAQSAGEFIVTDPSVIKSSTDATQDAFDTVLDNSRKEIQKRVNERGVAQTWRGEKIEPTIQSQSSGVPLTGETPLTSTKPSVGSAVKSVGSAVKSPGGAAIIGTIAGEVAKPYVEKTGATDWLADKLTPLIPDWALDKSPSERIRDAAQKMKEEDEDKTPVSKSIKDSVARMQGIPLPTGGNVGSGYGVEGDELKQAQAIRERQKKQAS